MIGPDQAAPNPGRADAWASLVRADFSNLTVVCSRFRADIGTLQQAPDALTSADLERDG